MAKVVAENLERYGGDRSPVVGDVFESVYWCEHCQIPLLGKACPLCHREARPCGRDLKPVFPAERALYEEVVGRRLPTYLFSNRNRVLFQGKTLFTLATDPCSGPRVGVDKTHRLDRLETDQLATGVESAEMPSSSTSGGALNQLSVYEHRYHDEQWRLCLSANREVLRELEDEALQFIRRQAARFSRRHIVVSFSGGKDSAVTAALVAKALPHSIPLLFGDTTIEFPDTIDYVNAFAEEYGMELHRERPDADFVTLCDTLGPPSRLMRWCCTVCKSRSINKHYEHLAVDVLSFDGIRRMESSRRAEYPRVVQIEKLSRQVAARPIVHWSSFAVWLYILSKGLPYNPLYDYGYSRVGCVYCPSNTPFNDYLTKVHFPELYQRWTDYLIQYATEAGKSDAKRYALGGNWKRRNIHKHRTVAVEPSKPCGEAEQYVYHFAEPVTKEIIEFLKPFGRLSLLDRAEATAFVVGRGNPLVITGTVGGNQLSVSYGPKHGRFLKMRIEKQIEKYLNCVHCGGCAGVCPHGAIEVRSGHYHIDENMCQKCGRCVTTKYLKGGCVALNFGVRKKAIRR